jgi:predicted nucleotidyltransferase
MAKPTLLHPDWREFFAALIDADVRFVLIGGLAVAVHAEPRFTEDLDVFVEASRTNAPRLRAALVAFGWGDAAPSVARLAKPGAVWMLGRKPLRIDVLTEIDGVSWEQAWSNRIAVDVDGMQLPCIGFDDLLANKIAAGRDKDLLDVVLLKRHSARRVGARKKKATRMKPR